MKTSISIFALLIGIFTSFSQDPAILWQKTIGGDDTDFSTVFESTIDGGFIIGGYSTSNISGEKTENSNGQIDIWIVKIDGPPNFHQCYFAKQFHLYYSVSRPKCRVDRC